MNRKVATTSNDWPAWATQQVEIHQWDATWHQQAADLIAVLAAKPVIDRQASVASFVRSELAHGVLVAADQPRCQQTLAFRDRRRQQPSLAKQYEHFERIAAQEHHSDREAYTGAKAGFIRSVVADLP